MRTLLLSVLLLHSLPSTSGADAPDGTASIEWVGTPALPDAVGFGGPIAGVHDGVLIVVGGANFPDAPPWSVDGKPAGSKVWHDGVFVLERGSALWKTGWRLPRPLAYAPAISTKDGIFVLGGETFGETTDPSTGESTRSNYPVADVLLIRWDGATVEVIEDALPPLPRPSHYHGAALHDQTIYVVAAHARDERSERLDSKSFWSLDLRKSAAERRWEELEPWPGPARTQMAVAVQNSGADDHDDTPPCLFLFSGMTWVRGADGEMDLARFEHFADAYRYNLKSKQWRRIADLPALPERREIDLTGYAFDGARRVWRRLEAGETQPQIDLNEVYRDEPRPVAAAPAIAVGNSHILIFSGATGRFVTLDVQDRPLFPRDVLAYHTITDTWVIAGRMPQGVVTTSIVGWDGKIAITSGEIRPGVRTNRVQVAVVKPRTTSFGTLNLVVVGFYLIALVGMGLYFSRREKRTDDYFLAGRRIPWWAAGLSIYATQLSAITFVSIPAVAYAGNWLAYPGQLTIFLMAPVVVYFYLPFFRRLNITTAYEYLERRFDLVARLLGSVSFIVFQFGRMAVVVYLPALALTAVTGLPSWVCIVLMGVLATVYTVLGGMEAVIWTDVLQVIVLWGGMLLAIALILADVGAPTVFQTALADNKFHAFNWTWDHTQMAAWLVLLGTFALQFGPYTTDQAVVQRYMTTRDLKAAGRSVWFNGVLVIPFSLLFFGLGTCLYVFFKVHPELLGIGMENDKIFPLFMAEQLPPGLSGLVIAGVFAASMSSLDSSMHSVATAITTDFYRRFRPQATDHESLILARVLTFVIGITGTAMALMLAAFDIKSLFFFFQKLLGLVSSGLVGMFILGIFTRRATSAGAIAGFFASFGVLCYVFLSTEIHFFLYAVIGIGTAVVVGYAVSLATRPPAKSLQGLTWRTPRNGT